MGQDRIASRRSFLAQVAGAALAVVVLGAPAHAGRRRRRMAVDADPRDPARPLTTPPPQRPRISGGMPMPPPGPPGPDIPAPSRFVICPGNRRCPGRNR